MTDKLTVFTDTKRLNNHKVQIILNRLQKANYYFFFLGDKELKFYIYIILKIFM